MFFCLLFLQCIVYKIGQICLSRPYHFRVFKGCLSQTLLGPFLNTLSQMLMEMLHFKKPPSPALQNSWLRAWRSQLNFKSRKYENISLLLIKLKTYHINQLTTYHIPHTTSNPGINICGPKKIKRSVIKWDISIS